MREDEVIPGADHHHETAACDQERAVISRLPDGTPYYGRLGQIDYDADDDLVQCHLCGRWMRFIGSTHLRWHGWTLQQCREAFHLRAHMPTCAHGMSNRLRHSAKQRIGKANFAIPPTPAASSSKPTPPWRSLARLHPDLTAELHPTRNPPIDLSQLAAGSKRKLWWRCPSCGAAWQATVVNRVTRHSGCPTCAIARRANTLSLVSPDRSLARKHPEIALELHPTLNANLDTRAVAANSTRRLCARCGHEWQATPANRSSGATGCPACWTARRPQAARTVPYHRSVAARNPQLAAQLDPQDNPEINPATLGTRSNQKLWWLCPACSHHWLARVADRTAGTGCPACGHRTPTGA